MAEKKVTMMVIKVDLQCEKCYRKIKRVLCQFPQIRDQTYDEKKNTVTIKVVCCSPEKIKKKICCKGGESVKGIDILVPEKPKPPPPVEKPKEPEKPKPPPPVEKPKEPEKPKPPPPVEKPKEPEKPKPPPPVEKPKEPEKPKEQEKPPKQPEPVPKPTVPQPVPVYPPPVTAFPIGVCCSECYEGRDGGPCQRGYGYPPRFYDGYCGTPVYDSWGGGTSRGGYGSRCDNYFSEENPSACSIM